MSGSLRKNRVSFEAVVHSDSSSIKYLKTRLTEHCQGYMCTLKVHEITWSKGICSVELLLYGSGRKRYIGILYDLRSPVCKHELHSLIHPYKDIQLQYISSECQNNLRARFTFCHTEPVCCDDKCDGYISKRARISPNSTSDETSPCSKSLATPLPVLRGSN